MHCLASNMKPESSGTIEIRRRSWGEVLTTLQKAGLDTPQKLADCQDLELIHRTMMRCQSIADVYAALTGDDSLMSPSDRDCRAELGGLLDKDWDRIQKRKAAKLKDEKMGVANIFDDF
jgi:hypothetical protein